MTTTYRPAHPYKVRDVPAPTHHRPASAPAPTAGGAFRRDIQGLRAVAILLVVLYHADLSVLSGGYVGVDVFFVISGFLITGNLYRELRQTGRISLHRFYARRMLRLLPASTLVAVTTLAAAWHWMPATVVKAITSDALAAATWLMNVHLAMQDTDYLSAQRDPSPFQHFWSLAVEEQFYVVWPLLLLVTALVWTRRGRLSTVGVAASIGVLTVASLAVCIWQTNTDLPWASFGIQARAWELGVGGLIAIGSDRLRSLPSRVAVLCSWAGLAAIAVAGVCYSNITVFPGYAALLPVIGAALVIAGGCNRSPAGADRVLRLGPMQEMGRLSYSWYLWHWPILVIVPYILDREPTPLLKLGLVVAALVPASISMVCLENQVRFHSFLRDRAGRSLALGAGLVGTAVLISVVASAAPVPVVKGTHKAVSASSIFSALDVDPARVAKLILASGRSNTLPAKLDPKLTDAAKDFPRDGNCIAPNDALTITFNVGMGCEHRGVDTAPRTVVLLGDSHAQHWFDALDVFAQRDRWRIVVFTKGGCTPAMALTVKYKSKKPFVECAKWRENALEAIAELRPAMVIMSSLTYAPAPFGVKGDPDVAWGRAWLATANRIRAAGATPVIIQDTPFPQYNVPNCLARNPTAIRRCGLQKARTVNLGRQRAIARAARVGGAKLIDPTPWFCTATICPAIIGDTLVYRDTSHMTATYSRLLGSLLAKELNR